MSKPRFRAVSSFPTRIKRNEGREAGLLDMTSCCGGTSVLGLSGENTERRRLIRVGERGLLDFSRQLHVGLVGFARFTPGAGKERGHWC